MGNETSVSVADTIKDALKVNLHSGTKNGIDPSESKRRRLDVIAEILSTEQTYLKILERLNVYEEKLVEKAFMKPENIKVLFCGLAALLGFHREFCKRLKSRLKQPLERKGYYTLLVGDIFAEYVSMMPVYSAFINNFDLANEKVAKLGNSKKFTKWETEFRADFNQLGLQDCLIAPVQRLPRYLLLLKSLISVTLESHKDFKAIHSSMNQIEKILQNVNSAKRLSEAQNQLFDLQARLDKSSTPLVAPSRVLCESFEIVRVIPEKAKSQKGFIVVCNDGVFAAWQSGPFNKMAINASLTLAVVSLKLTTPAIEPGVLQISDDVVVKFESEAEA